jgi:hypothetical protein
MAAAFQGGEVVTVGTTPQTAVAAPGASEQKQVLSLLAINRDSVSRTITAKKVGGTVTETIGSVVLAAGLRGQLIQASVVLDGTGESITVESDATATTTEPVVDVAVFKIP